MCNCHCRALAGISHVLAQSSLTTPLWNREHYSYHLTDEETDGREVKWRVQDHQSWALVTIRARAAHLSLPLQGACSVVWKLQTADHLSAEQELLAKKINVPTLLILLTLTTGEFFLLPSFDLSYYVYAKSLLSCSVLSKGQLGTFTLCAACTAVLRKGWETKHKLTWVGSLSLPLITKEGWTWRRDRDKNGIPTSGSEASTSLI